MNPNQLCFWGINENGVLAKSGSRFLYSERAVSLSKLGSRRAIRRNGSANRKRAIPKAFN